MELSTDGTSSIENGRYRLTGRLGAGGMAVIYAAFDTKLKVKRAIKVLNLQYAKNEKVRKRFLAEAQTMAQLRHPNIVTVYDVGLEGETPFIVMELVEGGSLHGYISNAGSYTAPLAARLIRGALKALQFAHENGVIHRDFKPHNILLTLEGVPKLTDFGVAQVADSDHSLTKTGAVIGTLAYMAPEQRMNAKESSVEVDIFAAGSSLYSMIKGSHSFDLYSTEFHNRLFEGLESDIRDVIVKSCQYEPSERYPSANSMSDALTPISKELSDEEWERFLVHIGEARPQQIELKDEPDKRDKSLDTFALDYGHSIAYVNPEPSVADNTLFTDNAVSLVGEGGRTRSFIYWALFFALALSVYLWGGGSNLADIQPPVSSAPTVSGDNLEPTLPDNIDPLNEALEADEEQAALAEQQGAPAVTEDPLVSETAPNVEVAQSAEESSSERSENQAAEPDPTTSDGAGIEADNNPVIADSGAVDTSTPIELFPVRVRINTVPASDLSIDGENVGYTRWSGELMPGEHTVEMTADDGRAQQTVITVSDGEEYTFCWNFDLEGPCTRSRRVREPNRRRNRDR